MIGREFLHQCCEPIILTGFSRHSTTQLFALRYDWLILVANAFLLKLRYTLFEIGIFHLLRVQSLFHSFFFAVQNKREGKHVLTKPFFVIISTGFKIAEQNQEEKRVHKHKQSSVRTSFQTSSSVQWLSVSTRSGFLRTQLLWVTWLTSELNECGAKRGQAREISLDSSQEWSRITAHVNHT